MRRSIPAALIVIAFCALALGSGGCDLLQSLVGGGPGGNPVPGIPSDSILLVIENQSGLPVTAVIDFHSAGEPVRQTTQFLADSGADAKSEILRTVADSIDIEARVAVDPFASTLSMPPPGSLLAQANLILNVDYEGGDTISFIIPAPPADCNENNIADADEISSGAVQDTDDNGVPDSCQPDTDSDGIIDTTDLCPQDPDPEQLDTDSDGLGNACDNCPLQANPDQADCDTDGIGDLCAMEPDCNSNGIPDSCDIASGTSQDANSDGEPDECFVGCPPLDVVFIMDTSGSMSDEAAALCSTIDSIVSNLQNQGIVVQPSLLGITEAPGGLFDCLTDSVLNLFGPAVPGLPACCAHLGNSEDWGPAVATVADRFPWTPLSVRVIVPISDEAPRNGDPCEDPGLDRDAINHAISLATTNSVVVSPISASGASSCTINLAQDLAQATGGMAFVSTDPGTDLADGIAALINNACTEAAGRAGQSPTP